MLPPLDRSTNRALCLYLCGMKQLYRTTDMASMAFAKALLQGEDIDCFEMDVNMSVLEGSIGIFPRRLMVVDADYEDARVVLEDNGFSLED
ncbi:hypothetical protein ACSSV8_000315 [Roseovarius sp. MBR-79]